MFGRFSQHKVGGARRPVTETGLQVFPFNVSILFSVTSYTCTQPTLHFLNTPTQGLGPLSAPEANAPFLSNFTASPECAQFCLNSERFCAKERDFADRDKRRTGFLGAP